MSDAQLTNIDNSSMQSILRQRLGIDARTLAAFRISLGLVLIVDLLLRIRNLGMFYTDDGVLPVSLLAEQSPMVARVSLHALSGEMWFQIVLVCIALIFALAVTIGYKTRIATGISLILLLSLHARNPYVLSGGDALLQHLLFWSVFLPLGERWSIDAHRRGAPREQIITAASASLLIQVLLVYGVNAVLKLRGERWMAGDAVASIFALDQFTVLLGPHLQELPVVLEIANWLWIGLLVASPLLILLTGRLRIILVGAFGAMHFGMLLTMHLGIFPLVSIIALIPFLPSDVWNTFDRNPLLNRLKLAVIPFQTFLSEKLPFGSSKNSFFGVEWSPIRLIQTIPAVLLVGVILFNAIALGFAPVPAQADETLSGAYSDSRWTMFAPYPPTEDRWYVAPSKTESANQVDAFHRSEIQWEHPNNIAATYSSARERKYMSNMRHDEDLRPSFARYLCERWNRNHEDELQTVSVYALETPTQTASDSAQERVKLVEQSCGTSAMQT